MVYHLSLKKNPKLYILFILAILLPIAGFASILLAGPIVGIIAGVVGLYIAYHVMKFSRNTLASRIITHDDGITIHMPDTDVVRFDWGEISHTGKVKKEGERDSAFIYAEEKDRFIQIPSEYSDFEHFLGEIEERTPFSVYSLDKNTSITDELRRIVGPPKKSEDEEEGEEPAEE